MWAINLSTNLRTRMRATRCETMRTVTTNNSKTLTFDILPQWFRNGSWQKSILIYHSLSLRTAHLSQKWTAMIFFHFWPIFIDRPWNLSIFIYGNQYGIWNFKMRPQNDSIELEWAENEPVFFPHSAVKLSILMCHTMDF